MSQQTYIVEYQGFEEHCVVQEVETDSDSFIELLSVDGKPRQWVDMHRYAICEEIIAQYNLI